MMTRWELIPAVNGFDLLRDGRRVIGVGGAYESASTVLRWYREQERDANEALAAGSPLALCRLGWHRDALPAPVAGHLGASLYFRFGAKIGEAGGTLVYRVAEEPFEFLARTVKYLGNLEPWQCSVCHRPIDGHPLARSAAEYVQSEDPEADTRL